MNTQELNEYIKNYLENDKTQRAIMLTAPWGSGKSYYIKNNLCNFLHEKKLDYAIVSLYGIKELKDVSKNLYLEIRANALTKKNEKAALVKIVGKTLLKGVAGLFHVDLNQSEEDLQKLYESIELTNRLIIFEDIERTSIDIVDFLGYVNNLVEQDGVKVLLVANEEEIKQIETVENGKVKKDENIKYIKIKEKTVSDTIKFTCDRNNSIENIIRQFTKNEWFSSMVDNPEFNLAGKIGQIMIKTESYNFRSLLFACQKTVDIFNMLPRSKNYNLDFLTKFFLETVEYCLREEELNRNKFNEEKPDSNNENNDSISKIISNFKIENRLNNVMKNYIDNQIFDINEFELMQSQFISSQKTEEANAVLYKIYYYLDFTEEELKSAIDELYEKLKTNTGISYNSYIKIAQYLFEIDKYISYQRINDCIKQMKNNLKTGIQVGDKVQTHVWGGSVIQNEKENDEFNKFRTYISSLIQEKNEIDFDYNPESIENYVFKDLKHQFMEDRGFMKQFNIEKLLAMLEKCSPKQIGYCNEILNQVYMAYYNVFDFMSDDLKNLIKLKNGVDSMIKENTNIDKIKKIRMGFLSDKLDVIIKKLRGEENV